MPQHQAKVYARIFTHERKGTTPDGGVEIMVEFLHLFPPQRSGKKSFTVAGLTNDTQLRDELRDALVAHLNLIYAPEVFQAKDIVGYSV